jgi:hypothetical protein
VFQSSRDPKVEVLLTNDKIKTIMTDYCTNKPSEIDALVLLPGTTQKEDLTTFLTTGKLKVEHARHHRKEFAKLGNALAELNKTMHPLNLVVVNERFLPIIAKVSQELAYVKNPIKMEEKIDSPFFDEQDLRIFSLINGLFLPGNSPVHKAFPVNKYEKLYQDSLKSVLVAVSESKDKIKADISDQRQEARKAIESKTPKDKDQLSQVSDAYDALDAFFTQIGYTEP